MRLGRTCERGAVGVVLWGGCVRDGLDWGKGERERDVGVRDEKWGSLRSGAFDFGSDDAADGCFWIVGLVLVFVHGSGF